jgi:hypothetical protein
VPAFSSDGHHARPLDLGFDAKAHPFWMEFFLQTGSENLFGGWHPGSLAHEVIGNQFASFYTDAANLALAQILKAEDTTDDTELEKLLVLAAKQPLPANVKVELLVLAAIVLIPFVSCLSPGSAMTLFAAQRSTSNVRTALSHEQRDRM